VMLIIISQIPGMKQEKKLRLQTTNELTFVKF
jgi:hypothetical protein